MTVRELPLDSVTTNTVNRCVRAGLLGHVGAGKKGMVKVLGVAKDDGGSSGRRIAGLDPGIAWFGVAVFDAMMLDGRVSLGMVAGRCIRTVKSDRKRKASSADDDFHRAKRVACELRGAFERHDVGMLIAEERSFPRGAAAIKSMAGAWGIIAALSDSMGLPVVAIPPKQLKLGLCGRAGASKDEVEAEVVRRFPLARGIADIDIDAGANNNHFFDAAGAAICGINHDEVLAWARGLGHE